MFELGQRVSYGAYMWRVKGGLMGRWLRTLLDDQQLGIVVGKRTVSDGNSD